MRMMPVLTTEVREILTDCTVDGSVCINTLMEKAGVNCGISDCIDIANILDSLFQWCLNIKKPFITLDDLYSFISFKYGVDYKFRKNAYFIQPNHYLLQLFDNFLTFNATQRPHYVIERSIINECIVCMMRRDKNSIVLVGNTGAGKYSTVLSLANRIALGEVPSTLLGRSILEIDSNSLKKEDRSHAIERIRYGLEYANSTDSIVYIRNIDLLMNMAGIEMFFELMNHKANTQMIITATDESYKTITQADPNIKEFNTIRVNTPVGDELLKILSHQKLLYETHHHINVPDSILPILSNVASKYIHDISNPGASVIILDTIGASISMSSTKLQPWRAAVQQNDFATASKLRNVFIVDHNKNIVTETNVIDAISSITGKKVVADDGSRISLLKEVLNEKVVGQTEIIDTICTDIKTSIAFNDGKRPISSFVFIGSSSVGKTYTAEIIADEMFDSNILRLDMSEYMEKHTVSRLIGAPPGYVGYQEGGILTEFVKMHPFSVILFDEIERSHPDVQNILLSILDKGELADMSSGVTKFSNTLIIMTSNIGTAHILSSKEYAIGFNNEKLDKKKDVIAEAKQVFSPALVDRIGRFLIFNKLGKDDLKKIIDLEINKLITETSPRVIFTDSLKEQMLSGWNDGDGARVIRKKVIDIISIVSNDDSKDKSKMVYTIDFDIENDKTFIFSIEEKSNENTSNQ